MSVLPTISNKKAKFLYALLRTKSLKELLPLYVAGVSKDKTLFPILPEDLIGPVLQSLSHIQRFAGPPDNSEELDFDEDSVRHKLKELDASELLSQYVSSVSRNATNYSVIPADLRHSAEYWLDELKSCITGTNGLFSIDFDSEGFIDQFISFAGGTRITEIVGEEIPTDNADYFFREQNVLVELKILQTDFLETNKEKLEAARKGALAKVRITPSMILGTDRTPPKELVDAEFEVLRGARQRITNKANRQIKNSKILLGQLEAKGIVMFLLDGFYSVSPLLTIQLLHEPISRHYSSVEAIIFLNLRRKITLDLGDGPFDYFVFQPGYKLPASKSIENFIDRLGKKWFGYLEGLSGKRFPKHILSYDPLNLSSAVWK